jgi:ferredoxin
MHAITGKDGEIAVVDRAKSIGCGLCITGCPSNVARIGRKAEEEIVNPPKDYATWEHERLVNRGLA